MLEPHELGMENAIDIRLRAIEFPDGRQATVSFELFADGFTVGETRRVLALLSQEVPHYKREQSGSTDHEAIVGEAAAKLSKDFSGVVDTLNSYANKGE
ncbi:MAG: hypothetical protein OXJ53_05550 [Gammaproteobacteria bacterium]|nr:hypothetical protein [Gammaproteobacteria bacterium]MDE0273544.1 hypothetical protein [Gammaproteobacteria bacterium]